MVPGDYESSRFRNTSNMTPPQLESINHMGEIVPPSTPMSPISIKYKHSSTSSVDERTPETVQN